MTRREWTGCFSANVFHETGASTPVSVQTLTSNDSVPEDPGPGGAVFITVRIFRCIYLPTKSVVLSSPACQYRFKHRQLALHAPALKAGATGR